MAQKPPPEIRAEAVRAALTSGLARKLKQKPNQSLRYENTSAFRKTLTTDCQLTFGISRQGRQDGRIVQRDETTFFEQIPDKCRFADLSWSDKIDDSCSRQSILQFWCQVSRKVFVDFVHPTRCHWASHEMSTDTLTIYPTVASPYDHQHRRSYPVASPASVSCSRSGRSRNGVSPKATKNCSVVT